MRLMCSRHESKWRNSNNPAVAYLYLVRPHAPALLGSADCCNSAFADQPTARCLLSAKESAALEEPIILGHRILAALSRYSKTSERVKVPTEYHVMARATAIEVLHGAG